jgi:hypothetical protein
MVVMVYLVLYDLMKTIVMGLHFIIFVRYCICVTYWKIYLH